MANRSSHFDRRFTIFIPLASVTALAISACSDDTKPLDGGTQDASVADLGFQDAEVFPDATADGGTAPDAMPDAGTPDTGPTGPRSIIFLHTNDEHSHELGFGPEIDDYPTPAATTNTTIKGGVKRRAKILDALRTAASTERVPVVTVGAGDIMMGSLFHIGNAAGPMVPAVDYAIATALQYDVMTLGNHEFDFGVGTIATALSTGGINATGQPGIVRIPILVSNIRFSMTDPDDDALANLYAPTGGSGKPLRRTHVQTFGSGMRAVKVGFIGLMGFDAALVAPFKTPVKFSLPEGPNACMNDSECPGSLCIPSASDAAATTGHCAASIDEADPTVVIPAMVGDAAGAVAELRAQGVDLVVAVTHVGVNEIELNSLEQMGMGPENAMFSEEIVLAKGVDMALTAADVPGIDVIIGGHSHTVLTEPLKIPNVRSGITTYIVQAGEYGQFVGKLKLAQAMGGEPWTLDETYSGLEPVDATTTPTGLPTFTEIVLNTVIDGLIAGLEDNVISNPGDNLIYPGEHCDGNFLPNMGDCQGLVPGATGGTLTCHNNRQLNMSACTFPAGLVCGNDYAEGDYEQCDGTDLHKQDCQTLGYDSGTLTCAANCTYNFSSCVPFFPSLLEAAINFQQPGSPIRNNPAQPGDIFFYQLGNTSFDIPKPVPAHESNLMNLVTDAMRWSVNQVDPGAMADPVRIAFNSNGVIRDPILRGETGNLGFSDLFRVLPLGVSPIENTPGYPMTDFYLRAAEVKAGLEIGVNQGLQADSFWLGVSGARVEYDLTRPAEDRVTKIQLTSPFANPYGDASGDLEMTPLYDAGAYRNGADELIHVASNLYIMLFAEALGLCPRDAAGNQLAECKTCTTMADCDPMYAPICAPDLRCRGGNPVAFRIRSFAPINSFGLFQELKEFLAFIHYIRNLQPGKVPLGTMPSEYNNPVPRRYCCVGAACTPDRVCN